MKQNKWNKTGICKYGYCHVKMKPNIYYLVPYYLVPTYEHNAPGTYYH